MNHKRFSIVFVIVFVGLLILLSPITIGAKEKNLQLPVSPSSAIGTAFTYQGRLTDGGVPANGSYNFRFYLWAEEAKSTLLSTYPGTGTIAVNVEDGYFTITLDFGVGIFDGNERWLEIEVNGTLLAPLQSITPAPYAIYAQTSPWSGLSGVPAGFADGTDDTLASQSCANGEVLKYSGTTWVCSPFNADTVDGYEGAALEESAEIDTDIAAHTAIVDAHHPRYTNEEAWTAVLGSDGTGSGLDADLLDGQQASSFANSTHEHNGADITSGTVAEPRIDAALTRDSEVMSRVLAGDGPGSGLNADLLDGYHSSAFASTTHEHNGADITSGTVAEPRIDAALTRDSEVMSRVLAGDGPGSGLNADYLDGYHSSAFASASHTHWGDSWSGAGTGLYLSSSNDIGLNSSGGWYGVWGETETGTAGTLGYATGTTGGGRGVWGYTNSNGGTGVRGDAAASSGTTYGVYGRSNSPGGYGVFGSTDDHYGVYGEAFATTGTNFGTYGQSHSTSGRGVWGWASASTGSGIGVGGGSAAGGYGLYTGNNLYVGGSCVGCSSVFIATNASQETLLVGEAVVAISVGPVLQGHSVPVLQVRHATLDDASVLGVVYRRGEFFPASDEQPEVGDIVQPGDGDIAPGDYLMVITSGLGQVRVDPGLGALAPGQSLTVATAAGLATAAMSDTSPELVFARLVETEPDSDGLLWALIDPR